MSHPPTSPDPPPAARPDPQSEIPGLFTSVRRVAALTLLSRILGLARDTVCATAFGAGPEFSAFVFAFMIPNLFRRLLGEGALSAAFIPTFAKTVQQKGQPAAWLLFRRTLGALLIVLAVLTAALYAISLLLAPRLASAENWQFVFPLVNTLIPFLPLICVIAFLGAALHAKHHFILPAASPVIINVFWIVGAAVALNLRQPLSSRIFLLSAAVLAGAAASLLFHLPVLKRLGAPLTPAFHLRDPALHEVAAKVAPVILGLSIIQINVLLDGLVARALISNVANSNLYYPNRLFQFPLALLGISVGTAAFPTLAKMVAQGRDRDARHTATRALAASVFLALPAAVGLAVLAKPILALLFQHGRFAADKTALMGPILSLYALGLPAACANQVLVRLFYAGGDTRTPVRIALLAMVANVALNLTLVWSLQERGLALATALAAWLQFALLFAVSQRHLHMLESQNLLRSLARSLALALVTAALVCFAFRYCTAAFDQANLAARTLCVLIPVAVGTISHLGLARLLRFPELATVLARR